MMKNEMTLAFDSISENEEFARVTVAAFASQLNPTLEEVADIRTAVSEAVTNAIIHGYPEGIHTIVLRVRMENQQLEVWVIDEGVGIADISKAYGTTLYQPSGSGAFRHGLYVHGKHLWTR